MDLVVQHQPHSSATRCFPPAPLSVATDRPPSSGRWPLVAGRSPLESPSLPSIVPGSTGHGPPWCAPRVSAAAAPRVGRNLPPDEKLPPWPQETPKQGPFRNRSSGRWKEALPLVNCSETGTVWWSGMPHSLRAPTLTSLTVETLLDSLTPWVRRRRVRPSFLARGKAPFNRQRNRTSTRPSSSQTPPSPLSSTLTSPKRSQDLVGLCPRFAGRSDRGISSSTQGSGSKSCPHHAASSTLPARTTW